MVDALLTLENVSKNFGALKASDDVTLDLRPGEIHALIGPNGAGKSTLIKQICGELAPDRGTIRFLGHNLSGLSTAARTRLGLGRTFQISALAMESTVRENAVLGAVGGHASPWRFFRSALKRAELVERADAALAQVGLLQKRNAVVATLSHGERRQLEIAVVLTLEPRAFLMDEPMAGMGADGSRHLTSLLAGLKHDAPILLVEHDMDAVFALADRITVLDYGRIIASGTGTEIREHSDVRRAYLGETA